MTLIGLSGYGRAGKDSVGEILVREFGLQRRAFADKVREAIYILNPMIGYTTGYQDRGIYLQELVDQYGWEQAKAKPDVRRLMQRMGTELARRTWDDDFWVKRLFDDYGGQAWMITDVRFPNEALAVQARGGLLWRINRPGFGPVNGHPSETALDHWSDWDAVIENDGSLEDLAQRVRDAFL
jgi:hypothetical protein